MMTEVIQKVQLVDGKFTPSEASDVIKALIKEKINFHKFQRLCVLEGDENGDCEYPNSRVAELQQELKTAQEIIAEARRDGKQLRINGILELEFVD